MAVMDSPTHIADSCRIAYKEWVGVCRALREGRQTILLRKGGIAEEGGVFRPEHAEFWLYPTELHQGQQGLIDQASSQSGAKTTGIVPLDLFARVESVYWIQRIEEALVLSEHHVWTEESVRKRFQYRQPGLWLILIRVYRRDTTLMIEERPEFAGCKTWVTLENPAAIGQLSPVLSEDEFLDRRNAIEPLLTPFDRMGAER